MFRIHTFIKAQLALTVCTLINHLVQPGKSPGETPHPDAVADLQQDVSLRRTLLVQATASNENHCQDK